jgi:hypothetical protein
LYSKPAWSEPIATGFERSKVGFISMLLANVRDQGVYSLGFIVYGLKSCEL